MTHAIGFDAERYLVRQAAAIMRLVVRSKEKLYIEFGGKIVDDKHAARVLPGYREDTKAAIIARLAAQGEVIFVVSAKDIMRGRIRGDFKIPYDREALWVIDELARRGIPVRHVAISMMPSGKTVPPRIRSFRTRLTRKDIAVHYFPEMNGYPSPRIRMRAFAAAPFIASRKRIVMILSPGGGSGKFGVCMSQLYHEMSRGVAPHYLKFETFPVHDLPLDHPLNLAYMAASADFYDMVMKDRRHGSATSYNRDIENYELLHVLARSFPGQGRYLRKLTSATYMGVNQLTSGIIDEELVQKEAAAEIARRLVRYKFEIAEGKEDQRVVARARKILRML